MAVAATPAVDGDGSPSPSADPDANGPSDPTRPYRPRRRATGASSEGDASVKAEAGADEIANIVAPAKAAANPPTRTRFTI